MKQIMIFLALLAVGLPSGGCNKASSPDDTTPKTHMHKDVPPHGGFPVPLGDDYNLELVHDSGSGTLVAYVLDDEMEEFVRASDASVTLTARFGGQTHTVRLAAVANPATGETVGDTSMFEGQGDWLKTVSRFDGTVERITVRGSPFVGVTFQFQDGHEGN